MLDCQGAQSQYAIGSRILNHHVVVERHNALHRFADHSGYARRNDFEHVLGGEGEAEGVSKREVRDDCTQYIV